jgi:ectoine hydroxylase-related dioxygenase (phytanoyl-CoA dioxygenase family)
MNSIFLNKQHSDAFLKQGFIIRPFLSLSQINHLNDIASKIKLPEKTFFYSTSFIDDIEFKQKLSGDIIEIVKSSLQELFIDYKILGGNFLYKLPGKEGEMPLHQDWTVTDESQFQSITLWIPLSDTNILNGTMQCIPGSQNWTDTLRSPSLPVNFKEVHSSLKDHLQMYNVSKGEAFIFNHALLHASPPNLSDAVRSVLTIGLTHKDASLSMYYYEKGGKVSQYSMPDNMFLNYDDIHPIPRIGKLEKIFNYEVKPFTYSQITNHLYEYRKENFTMKPIFKNPENQRFFEENGYLKIPALQQDQINQLLSLQKELGIHDINGHGFYVGMDNKDKQLVGRMMDRIIEIALPAVKDQMTDVQVFTASYVIKEPNPKGVVPPHQDWSFVEDEKEHCSLTCWIPLVDVNMDNGCLGVIPGSNRFFSSVRPSPSPQVPTPLSKHMFLLFPYLKLIEMKAGEALLFDNRTIHASPPNVTESPRIAVGMAFTQADAKIRHYYLKPKTKDTVIKYEVTPDFFRKYDNATLSEMYNRNEVIKDFKVIEETKYLYEDLSAKEFVNRIEAAGNVMNSTLVVRMTELFKNEMTSMQSNSKAGNEDGALSGFQKSFIYRLRPSNLLSAFKYYVLNQRA